MASNPNYQSYLLRLWRDGADQPWRASLQCTATAEKFAFADLRTLLAFLVEQLAVDEEPRATQDNPASTQNSLCSSCRKGKNL